MGKRRDLNGLPNTLTQRYFSTLFYYGKGYMGDWIYNAAEQAQVKEIKIDLLNDRVSPTTIDIKPITAHLDRLKETIKLTLEKNGFEKDFITEAHFDIYISQKFKAMRLFTCTAHLRDKEGVEYKGKIYTEKAYDKFDVRGQLFLRRIKNWLRIS